jgi:Flp pilus assembly protein TadD
MRNGTLDEAIAHFTEAIRLDPYDPDAKAYTERCSAYSQKGDGAKAAEDQARAAELQHLSFDESMN